MTQVAVLESVQVGSPGRYNSPKRGAAERGVWETSFFRTPSPESRWLHLTHLDGNAQADTVNHGKPEQAVLLYASAHYPVWRPNWVIPRVDRVVSLRTSQSTGWMRKPRASATSMPSATRRSE